MEPVAETGMFTMEFGGVVGRLWEVCIRFFFVCSFWRSGRDRASLVSGTKQSGGGEHGRRLGYSEQGGEDEPTQATSGLWLAVLVSGMGSWTDG
jgi:hypothetical protein